MSDEEYLVCIMCRLSFDIISDLILRECEPLRFPCSPMSEAKSGECRPAYRFAHAGYDSCTSDVILRSRRRRRLEGWNTHRVGFHPSRRPLRGLLRMTAVFCFTRSQLDFGQFSLSGYAYSASIFDAGWNFLTVSGAPETVRNQAFPHVLRYSALP